MKALECSIRIGWKEHRRPLLEKTHRSFFEIKRILLSNVFFFIALDLKAVVGKV